jgi:hypothetical protein
VIKDNNIQSKTNRKPPETRTGRIAAGADSCRARSFSGNPLASDNLQESRSSPSETGEVNGDPHAHDQGYKTPGACWSRVKTRTNRTGSSNDHYDQRRSATTTERSLSEKLQPSLVDLALTTSLQETTNTCRSPRTWTRNLLFAPTHNNKKKKTKLPPLDLVLGIKNHHWKQNQGNKNHPRLRRLGDKTSAE